MIFFPLLMFKLLTFESFSINYFIYLFFFNFFKEIKIKYPIFLLFSFFISKEIFIGFLTYCIYKILVSNLEIYPFGVFLYSKPRFRILDLEKISLFILIFLCLI